MYFLWISSSLLFVKTSKTSDPRVRIFEFGAAQTRGIEAAAVRAAMREDLQLLAGAVRAIMIKMPGLRLPPDFLSALDREIRKLDRRRPHSPEPKLRTTTEHRVRPPRG